MLQQLIEIDRQLLLMLNGSDSAFLDSFMMSITHTSTWVPVALLLVVLLLRNNNRGTVLLAIAGIALTILLADQFSSTFCKPFFHRLRPSHDPSFGAAVDIVNGYRGGLYGFISSHAANTFGVAVFMSCLVKHFSFTSTMLFWASMSSYSRIYLGVHFPGDILCGALWGILTGSLVYALFMYLCRRLYGQKPFFSSRYTRAGYLIEDVYWLEASIFITYIFVIFKSCL